MDNSETIFIESTRDRRQHGNACLIQMELNPWTDLSAPVAAGAVERIGLLPQGTAAGRPSVALLIRLPDGTPVIAQTTWALLSTAVRALSASPVAESDRRQHP